MESLSRRAGRAALSAQLSVRATLLCVHANRLAGVPLPYHKKAAPRTLALPLDGPTDRGRIMLLLFLVAIDSGPENGEILSRTGLLPPEGNEPAAFLLCIRPAWLPPCRAGKMSTMIAYWTPRAVVLIVPCPVRLHKRKVHYR